MFTLNQKVILQLLFQKQNHVTQCMAPGPQYNRTLKTGSDFNIIFYAGRGSGMKVYDVQINTAYS